MAISPVALIRASHPQPAVAVTTVTALLAAAAGRPAGGVVAAAVAVLTSQLATGWHNDWLDADRDTAAGRRDKPIATGAIGRSTVGVAALVAAVLVVPLALLSGWPAAAAAAVGIGGSLSYNAFFKFTPLSVLPYAVSFATLPAFVFLGAGSTPTWWLLAAGATLGSGAHFANVVPDLADDAKTGVRGLPHRLGPVGSLVAAATLLTATTALLAFGPPGPPSPVSLIGFAGAVAVLAAGGYAQRRRPASDVAFHTVMAVAVIDVGLLIAAGSVA